MPILLNKNTAFPDPALADAEGLVAIGGDLGPDRLLMAYRQGIFPWTANPITWWSPDPRAIFELDGFHVPQSLARVIRQGRFEVTMDQSFRAVMEGCAAPAPGRGGAWITEEFIEAYTRLHRLGHAHSVECRLQGRTGGRNLRRDRRRPVRGRIHVPPRQRCFQGGAASSGRSFAPARLCVVRHPDGDARHQAAGRHRNPAPRIPAPPLRRCENEVFFLTPGAPAFIAAEQRTIIAHGETT